MKKKTKQPEATNVTENSNVVVECHTVWTTEQIKEVIEKADRYNGIIKVEVTHGFEPGKKRFEVIVFRYPSLNS